MYYQIYKKIGGGGEGRGECMAPSQDDIEVCVGGGGGGIYTGAKVLYIFLQEW